MSDIAPCPFCCGMRAEVVKAIAFISDAKRRVWCPDCEAYGPSAFTDAGAVTFWNLSSHEPA